MNDQQLMLYALNEGLAADERLAIARALAQDPALNARLQQLQVDLDALRGFPDAEPSAAAQRRWHDALQRADRLSAAPAKRATRWLARPLALAAVVGAVVIGGVLVRSEWLPPTPIAVLPKAPLHSVARGMQQQFADSEMALASLGGQPQSDSALINELVAQHRVFERLAMQSGEPELARVLRAMEPMLLALERPGVGTDNDELRAQLQFELAAMQTKLAAAPSKKLPMQSL